MKRLFAAIALMTIVASATVYAQQVSANRSEIDPKVSDAYSLLIQRKVKLQAELEGMLREYSSAWPPAKRLQFELDALKTEMRRMSEVDQAKTSKLTSGYGNLVLRKASLTGEIQLLLIEQSSEWPLTKDKQRELELLDGEIQDLMK
jgi:hypothetical protein